MKRLSVESGLHGGQLPIRNDGETILLNELSMLGGGGTRIALVRSSNRREPKWFCLKTPAVLEPVPGLVAIGRSGRG